MIEHKRYMLFGGAHYYPTGPDDYIESYDTLEELSTAVSSMRNGAPYQRHDWYQFIDLEDNTVNNI